MVGWGVHGHKCCLGLVCVCVFVFRVWYIDVWRLLPKLLLIFYLDTPSHTYSHTHSSLLSQHTCKHTHTWKQMKRLFGFRTHTHAHTCTTWQFLSIDSIFIAKLAKFAGFVPQKRNLSLSNKVFAGMPASLPAKQLQESCRLCVLWHFVFLLFLCVCVCCFCFVILNEVNTEPQILVRVILAMCVVSYCYQSAYQPTNQLTISRSMTTISVLLWLLQEISQLTWHFVSGGVDGQSSFMSGICYRIRSTFNCEPRLELCCVQEKVTLISE